MLCYVSKGRIKEPTSTKVFIIIGSIMVSVPHKFCTSAQKTIRQLDDTVKCKSLPGMNSMVPFNSRFRQSLQQQL